MYKLKSTYDTGSTCTQERKNREIMRMARKLADGENEPQETNLDKGDSESSLERDSQISGKTHLSASRQISNDIGNQKRRDHNAPTIQAVQMCLRTIL